MVVKGISEVAKAITTKVGSKDYKEVILKVGNKTTKIDAKRFRVFYGFESFGSKEECVMICLGATELNVYNAKAKVLVNTIHIFDGNNKKGTLTFK